MKREELISRLAERAGRHDDSEETLYRLIVTGIPRELAGTDHRNRIKMTAGRPPTTGTHWDSLIAALVEHAASCMGFPVPAWTQEPARFLKEPWIGGTGPRSWSQALHAAPAAFIRHGAFIDPRSLNPRGGDTTRWV